MMLEVFERTRSNVDVVYLDLIFAFGIFALNRLGVILMRELESSGGILSHSTSTLRPVRSL